MVRHSRLEIRLFYSASWVPVSRIKMVELECCSRTVAEYISAVLFESSIRVSLSLNGKEKYVVRFGLISNLSVL